MKIYVAFYSDCHHEGMWPIGYFRTKAGAYRCARQRAIDEWVKDREATLRYGGAFRLGMTPLSMARWAVREVEVQD